MDPNLLMDPNVFCGLMILAFFGAVLGGLRLAVQGQQRRCTETQAEIRRLVDLFEPGGPRRVG
jgi:hypothetical protein